MSVGFCRHLVLYPQNGDRVVTVDYITSVYLNAPAMVHLQRRSAVITRPRFLTFAADRFTYYSHFHFSADASFVSGLLTSSATVKTETPSNDVTKNWVSPVAAPAAATDDKGMPSDRCCDGIVSPLSAWEYMISMSLCVSVCLSVCLRAYLRLNVQSWPNFLLRPRLAEYRDARVCLCVCVFVYPLSYLRSDLHQIFVHFSFTYGRGSVLLWRRSDTLCTSVIRMTSHLLVSCSTSTSPPS